MQLLTIIRSFFLLFFFAFSMRSTLSFHNSGSRKKGGAPVRFPSLSYTTRMKNSLQTCEETVNKRVIKEKAALSS